MNLLNTTSKGASRRKGLSLFEFVATLEIAAVGVPSLKPICRQHHFRTNLNAAALLALLTNMKSNCPGFLAQNTSFPFKVHRELKTRLANIASRSLNAVVPRLWNYSVSVTVSTLLTYPSFSDNHQSPGPLLTLFCTVKLYMTNTSPNLSSHCVV